MCNSYDAKKQIIAFPFPSTRVVPRLQTYGTVINTIHFNYYSEHELHNTLANSLRKNAVYTHGISSEKESEININSAFCELLPPCPQHLWFCKPSDLPEIQICWLFVREKE